MGAGAVRGVEGEDARRELGHVDAAVDARQPPREQPIPAFEPVDGDDVVGQRQGQLDRPRQTPLGSRPHDQPVHHRVDPVVLVPVEAQRLVERVDLAVHPNLEQPAGPQRRELVLELALAPAHDRRQDVDPLVRRPLHDRVHDLRDRLRADHPPARRAVRHADVGEQQAQVVVDLGHRADRRPRVGAGRALFDRDGGRQAVDLVDVRLLDLLQELAGVRRQRLHVAPLPLGVDGVEGEGGLAGPRQAGDHDEPVARYPNVDVLEVVYARSAHINPSRRCLHGKEPLSGPESAMLPLSGAAGPVAMRRWIRRVWRETRPSVPPASSRRTARGEAARRP